MGLFRSASARSEREPGHPSLVDKNRQITLTGARAERNLCVLRVTARTIATTSRETAAARREDGKLEPTSFGGIVIQAKLARPRAGDLLEPEQ
jgi:hypothetical protein